MIPEWWSMAMAMPEGDGHEAQFQKKNETRHPEIREYIQIKILGTSEPFLPKLMGSL